MNRCKLVLATLGAAVLLCAAVGTASARSFSSSTQAMRATWHEFEIREINGATVLCPLTLEGSMHARTFAKVSEALIGYVNRAVLGPVEGCPLFEWRLLTETLPWHIRYRSFSGLLPNIVTIVESVVGFAFQFRESLGASCLTRTTASEPLILTYARASGGGLTEVTASGSAAGTCTPFGSNRLSFGGRTRAIQPTNITLI